MYYFLLCGAVCAFSFVFMVIETDNMVIET
jgi:hypothetical protein